MIAEPVGFFKFPRRLYQTCGHLPPASWKVLIHILANANIRPGTFMGRTINPGQLACSVETLSRACGVSTQQTRYALSSIQNANVLAIETTNKFSVITVLDWPTYSGNPDDKQQTEEQAEWQALPQTNDKRFSNNQRSKNIRSKKEEEECAREALLSPTPPPSISATRKPHLVQPAKDDVRAFIEAHYDEFAAAYPGTGGRPLTIDEAVKAYRREAGKPPLTDWWAGILQSAERYRQYLNREGEKARDSPFYFEDSFYRKTWPGVVNRQSLVDLFPRQPDEEAARWIAEPPPPAPPKPVTPTPANRVMDPDWCIHCSGTRKIFREGITFQEEDEDELMIPCPHCRKAS